jgi:hypothetical protein
MYYSIRNVFIISIFILLLMLMLMLMLVILTSIDKNKTIFLIMANVK